MVRGKKVTIPDYDGDLLESRSSRSPIAPAPFRKRLFGRAVNLRASSSVRRSTVMRPRTVSTRAPVYTVQRKWRVSLKAVMSINPHYEGVRFLCYMNLLLQFLLTFLSIWWAKRRLSTRVVRKMVVCQIIGLIIMGFLFSTGGVFNISISSKSTNHYTTDFYWAMTIVSMVVFALSVMGCIGVFRPNMFITQIYAVVSFIFGHLIFSVVLAWYLLVILDAHLSDKYFQNSEHLPNGSSPYIKHIHRLHHSNELTEGSLSDPEYDASPIWRPAKYNNGSIDEPGIMSNNSSSDNVRNANTTATTVGHEKDRILSYRSDEHIFKDKLLRQYCLMLLFASIIMMSSGVLTTKLLIQVRRKQGYLYVDFHEDTQGAEPLPEPSHSRTKENVF